MLLGFLNYLVFDCGMLVVLIKNNDDDMERYVKHVGLLRVFLSS